jgi:hypothetical protein
MKKFFSYLVGIIIIALVIISIIFIIKKKPDKGHIISSPAVVINGRVVNIKNEVIVQLNGIKKLFIFENTAKINLESTSRNDTAYIKITYWQDQKKDLNFIPEKGYFEKGETASIYIESIEGKIPTDMELNIKQKDTTIMLSNLRRSLIFIDVDRLDLYAEGLKKIKKMTLITKNGSIDMIRSDINRLKLNASSGELSFTNLNLEEGKIILKSMNSLVANSNIEKLDLDIKSGYIQLLDSKIGKLSINSNSAITSLTNNDIKKCAFFLDDGSLNLERNRIDSISVNSKKSIIKSDTILPTGIEKQGPNIIQMF